MEPMLNAIRPTGQKAAKTDIKPVEDAAAAAAWADAFSAESGEAKATMEPLPEVDLTADETLEEEVIDGDAPTVDGADIDTHDAEDVIDSPDINAEAKAAVVADPSTATPRAETTDESKRPLRRVGPREAFTQLKPLVPSETSSQASEALKQAQPGVNPAPFEQAGLSPLGQQVSQLARAQSGKSTTKGEGDKATPATAIADLRSATPAAFGKAAQDTAQTSTKPADADPAPDLQIKPHDRDFVARDRNVADTPVVANANATLIKPKPAAKEPTGHALEPLERPAAAHLTTPAPDTSTRATHLIDAPNRPDSMAASVSRQLTAAITPMREGVTEVRLTPEELGRIRMTVSTVDGALHIAINADRPETADLMRRSLDQLRQDLNDMGFADANIDLHQGQQDQQDQADQPRDWTNTRTVALANDAEPEPSQRAVVSDRLDLRL